MDLSTLIQHLVIHTSPPLLLSSYFSVNENAVKVRISLRTALGDKAVSLKVHCDSFICTRQQTVSEEEFVSTAWFSSIPGTTLSSTCSGPRWLTPWGSTTVSTTAAWTSRKFQPSSRSGRSSLDWPLTRPFTCECFLTCVQSGARPSAGSDSADFLLPSRRQPTKSLTIHSEGRLGGGHHVSAWLLRFATMNEWLQLNSSQFSEFRASSADTAEEIWHYFASVMLAATFSSNKTNEVPCWAMNCVLLSIITITQ